MVIAKKFRSVEDILRTVKELSDQHRLDTQLVDKTTKALAKVVTAHDVSFKILDFTDNDGALAPKRKRTMNVDFPTVKVPNTKELMHSYDLAESLSEKYKMILNLENEMNINFSDMSKNGKVIRAKGEITKLKVAIEKDLKRLFVTLNEVANGHAPKQYLDFVRALARDLQENKHIDCDSGKTMTYAATGKDEKGNSTLIFAGYIMLINAVSDDGKVAPALYIVVKWTVGGNVEIFVEHEFIAPSLLKNGITVGNLKEATRAVTDQLTLEGFSAQLGNLPVDMQLKYPQGTGLVPNLFRSRDMISSVSADEDALVFQIKKEYRARIEEIKLELFQEVKAMVRNRKTTKVRMQVKGNEIIFTFSGLDQTGGIHVSDLDFLGNKYKLTNSQLRKIVNVINGE